MELTILLAKVFGVYLLVGGLAYMIRQRYFMSVVHDWVEHRALRMLVAVAEFIAGLFLIMTHNVWTTTPEAVVSLLGWVLVLEGVFYLIVSDKIVRKIIRMINTRAWYIGGGILSVLAGLYLINFGFSLGLL